MSRNQKNIKAHDCKWLLVVVKIHTISRAISGGEKGRHLWSRLAQKIAEGKTSHELSWKVKVMTKKINKNNSTRPSVWAAEHEGPTSDPPTVALLPLRYHSSITLYSGVYGNCTVPARYYSTIRIVLHYLYCALTTEFKYHTYSAYSTLRDQWQMLNLQRGTLARYSVLVLVPRWKLAVARL